MTFFSVYGQTKKVSTMIPGFKLSESNRNQIDALLKADSEFQGIAVLYKGKEKVFERSKGYSVPSNRKQHFSTKTLFDVGSITKSLLGVSAIYLSEIGALDLEQSISHFFEIPSKYSKVTIEDMLNHTSGFAYPSDFSSVENSTDFYTQTASSYYGKIFSMTPTFKHGEFLYNNFNYSALSSVLETVTNMNFELLADSYIFQPLGMKNSTFALGKTRPAPRNAALGISDETENLYAGQLPRGLGRSGATGWVTNSEELLLFARSVWRGDLLSDNSRKRLFSYPKKLNGPYASKSPYTETGYAHGWLVERYKESQKVFRIFHSGGTVGFCASLSYWPESDITLTMLSNDPKKAKWGFQFADLFSGALL